MTKHSEGTTFLYRRAGGSAVPQQRKAKATKPAPKPVPKSTSDEDDYDVTVGFSVESLPRSDVWDLLDVVGYHLHELEENPGTWARIATYSGQTAHEVANKRTGKLEAELRNPHLQFQVRRISQAEVGLFISWSSR